VILSGTVARSMLRRRGVPVSSFSVMAQACQGLIGLTGKDETSQMALHRDIYWVGRQWAVTGHGIQACDQKQKSQHDIEASRLWEDGVLENARALKWLNTEDFDKAISVARKYYPEPPRKTPPAEKPVSLPKSELPKSEVPSTESPKPLVRTFEMRSEGLRAKFVPVWRIRARGSGR
jgi:hypothetical protein